jgi:hypothetical protein
VRRAGAASGSHASAMSEKPRRYLSYLLRLWEASSGGELVWRASLEDPHTGERRGFAGLGELIAYLEGEMRDDPHTGDCPGSLEDERG